MSGELEKGGSLTLSSSPVVPYANVTLDNGQQVTVLLENPKGISLGHNKPQAVSNNSISAFEHTDVCVSELEHVKL